MMNKNIKKLFVFFGSDLNGYPNNFLNDLHTKGYEFLALDIQAVECVSLCHLPFMVITDWLDTKTMIEIQDIANNCQHNWFKPIHQEFTSSGICWPEFDHHAMKEFWLDAICSLKLADAFRGSNLEEIMIIKENNPTPTLFYEGCGIHHNLWEIELGDILNIIDSKESVDSINNNRIFQKKLYPIFLKVIEFINALQNNTSLKNKIKITIDSIFRVISILLVRIRFPLGRLYLNTDDLNGKFAFLASSTELSRSEDLLHDLKSTFPKNVVIIPNKMDKLAAYLVSKKWKLPVIQAKQKNNICNNLSEKFSNAYTELVKLTENQTINKILKALPFHFLYYCNYRWPMLDRDFKNYLHLFSYKPPKLLIGAHLYHAEWIIPILAAKRCGIDTISIPHGFVQVSHNYNLFLTTKKSLFDYILYVYPLQKEIFKYDSYINETRFIPCKNCTDINSHQVRIICIRSSKTDPLFMKTLIIN